MKPSTERLAWLKRELRELRSRMQRIEHETFAATRQLNEVEAELTGLTGSGEAEAKP